MDQQRFRDSQIPAWCGACICHHTAPEAEAGRVNDSLSYSQFQVIQRSETDDFIAKARYLFVCFFPSWFNKDLFILRKRS